MKTLHKKQVEAEQRAIARAARTTAQQMALVAKRRGSSKREMDRLVLDRVTKTKPSQ